MSKVFNMVGGGGKNISSIIITGLESTDIVTCTKDGKSYTATWYETAKHWEIIGLPLGTFTVTATNGVKTKTETVLIDITGVYEIEMSLKLWLYRDGDDCEDVTGGWSLTPMSGNICKVIASTNNILQISSDYTKLYMDVEVTQGVADGNGGFFFNESGTNGKFNVLGRETYAYDLSNYEHSAYPLHVETGGGAYGTAGSVIIAEKQDSLIKLFYNVNSTNRQILIYRIWAE